MRRRLFFFWAVLAWAGAFSSSAQVEARFVRIQATTDVVLVKSTFKSREPMRLDKFTSPGRRIGEAVLLVDWLPARALPAGAKVRFEYLRAGSDRIQMEERVYARAITGLQQERFGVLIWDSELDRVAAWRIQLMHGVRILDEQKSAAWR